MPSSLGLRQPKALLLLGAGASSDIVPGTRELTSDLLERCEMGVPIPPDAVERMAADTFDNGTVRYFRLLASVFRERCRRPPDFEELIHLAAVLASHAPDPYEGLLDQVPAAHAVLEIAKGAGEFKLQLENHWACQIACKHILNKIRASLRLQGSDGISSAAVNQLLRALAKRQMLLRVFSLNYDHVPTFSGLSFETGFVSQSESAQTFQPHALLGMHPGHIFCQLHGSVLFSVRKRDEMGPSEIIRFDSAENAEKYSELKSSVRGYYDPFHRLQDGSRIPNMEMITGLRKADGLLFEPYATYSDILFRELLSADLWFVIGYGGRDLHVNCCLSRALRIRREAGNLPRLVLVDKLSTSAHGNEIPVRYVMERIAPFMGQGAITDRRFYGGPRGNEPVAAGQFLGLMPFTVFDGWRVAIGRDGVEAMSEQALALALAIAK